MPIWKSNQKYGAEVYMWTIKDIPKKFGILVLCGGIYPEGQGGAEVHLFYVCRELAEQGYHIFVISPTSKISSRASEKHIPFVRIYIKLWPKPFATLSYIVKSFVESYRLKQQIEIVHAHMAAYPMVAAFMSSLITHKPYIVSCQGSDVRISSRKFLHRIFRIPFLHHARKIATVSNEMAEILKQKFGIPECHIVVVGTGYDEEIVAELKNANSHAEIRRGMHIINVAYMRPEKNHRILLESFATLTGSIKGVRLSLVGDGPLREELEKFCKQQGIHDVEFLGELPYREVLKQVANSDIFILTSLEEGMPNAIIEALALGKPVIATAVGGIPEVVKDGVNGILVPPKSTEHIAKALERLLSDSELRRKLGEAAAESVKDYTWSKIAEKYERIYMAAREKH